jgi:hypothetical protein
MLKSLLIGIIIICIIVFVYWEFFSKAEISEWRKKTIRKLRSIDTQNHTDNIQTLSQNLISLDKLLHFVLQNKISKGENFAEKLKFAKHLWSKDMYNDIWQAHKYRNEIVHNIDFKPTGKTLMVNISIFKKAIRKAI